MMPRKPRSHRSESERKPDHEADSIKITANEVKVEKDSYFPRTATHGGNYLKAKGDVEVEIRRPISDGDSDSRPAFGSVFVGSGSEKEIVVTARRVEKKKGKARNGKEVGTASGNVRIFGALRRRKKVSGRRKR